MRAHLDECAVVLERVQMVSIRSESDVSVGAHREKGDVLDAEEIGYDGIDVSNIFGQIGIGAEGDHRLEQGRIDDDLLERDKEISERRASCGWAAEKYQGMPDAVDELMKSTGRGARRLDRDCMRQA